MHKEVVSCFSRSQSGLKPRGFRIERSGWKVWIEPLQQTHLSMDPALFDSQKTPLKLPAAIQKTQGSKDRQMSSVKAAIGALIIIISLSTPT